MLNGLPKGKQNAKLSKTIKLVCDYAAKFPKAKITLELVGSLHQSEIIIKSPNGEKLSVKNLKTTLESISYEGGTLQEKQFAYSDLKADTLMLVSDQSGL